MDQKGPMYLIENNNEGLIYTRRPVKRTSSYPEHIPLLPGAYPRVTKAPEAHLATTAVTIFATPIALSIICVQVSARG